MVSASSGTGSSKLRTYFRSPTIFITLTLIGVYVSVGAAVADFVYPIRPETTGNFVVMLMMQCDGPTPTLPWTILTTIFLHANILHLASNLFFLVFFGFILEERVTRSQWMMTFFITGIAGSIGFVGSDVVSNILTSTPNAEFPDCAVGASGAVYGIMGTAVGLRVVILLIFLLGLNIFAGGGTPAHLGGLIAGLFLRKHWSLGDKPFRGI